MSAPRMTSLSTRGLVAAIAALTLSLASLVAAAPASAATTITVNTTADTDANGACTDETETQPASPTSLRNALCVASNIGGASTITVPAGTYTLTGTLALGTTAGTDVTLESSGGRARIAGDGTFQLLAIDPGLVGDISVTVDGFAFSFGRDSVYGGGAIIAGAVDSPPDTLVVRDTLFTGNISAGGTGTPGGAIQFIGGDLTITDSTFDSNSGGASSGGAVYYEARNSGDSLQVTGSTFASNSVQAAGGVPAGGGAIAFDAVGAVSMTVDISGNTFTGNTAIGSAGSPGLGGAIRQLHGPAVIDGNVFSNNAATGTGSGGSAVHATGGSLSARYNSIAGNTGGIAVQADASTTATLTSNWWGCNTGAGGAGCNGASIASGTTTPYLVLSAVRSASALTSGQTSTLTASLLTDSASNAVDPSKLGAFAGRTVSWSSVSPSGSSVSPSPAAFAGGVATATYTAGSTPGVGGVSALFDSVSIALPITIRQDATFTSPDVLHTAIGGAVDFTVTASGYPVPTVAFDSGSLPNGLSVSYSGATARITGTPQPGTTGSYSLTLTADNGGGPVSQTLTVTVGELPAFTSALSATVPAGTAVDVTVTTSGAPTPTIAATGGMPAGLTLNDNGDGTARLHGTPTAPAGAYSIGLSATNTAGTAPATFELQLTATPSFLSADSTTFVAGVPGSFPVTIDQGFPAHPTVTMTGAPAWLALGGSPGSQALTGTPPPGAGGVHALVLSIAGSGVTQSFSLRVDEAPAVTAQPASTSVISGVDAVFTASASGFPVPTVQWQRDVGGSWTPIAGATSTTLTIPTSMTDAGARVRAVFSNASGTITTNEAVLAVGQVPGIQAIAPVTLAVGSHITIPIATTGLPVGAITATGVPAWLAFTDNANGTATLTGTPALADAGTVTIGLHVSNGFGTADSTVQVTAVGSLPQFTGMMSETVAEGDTVDVTITTGGVPTPAITAALSLPGGLVLTDNHDGTARLHGTTDAGPGQYDIGLLATNTHGTTPGTFTLTITAPPRFLSAPTSTVLVGTPVVVPIVVDPGHPSLSVVSLSGAPAWLQITPGPGPQLLIGVPPVNSGGTYTFDLSIDGSSVVQEFTLTVNEAPVVSLQPLPKTVVDGDSVTFTAAATGYPAPTVRWQRLIGGAWTDIDGASSPTLSFAAGIADDGARVRAVFSNVAGTAESNEVVLTVGQLPAFTPVAPVTALAGGALAIDITATGLPSGTITASGVPAWLTFTDAGDGTATLTGTPALADAGTFEVPLHVDNGFGTADLTVRIAVETAVPLPYQLPSQTDGALTGVPGSVVRGQQITIGGSGFLPGAPIRVGMYSVPAALGTAVADQTGAFTAVVTIPADMPAGAHTIVAAGIGADGTARLLAAGTTVSVPVSGGSSSGGLATTGADGSVTTGLALLALISVLGGLALIRRARRRMI